MTRRKSRPLLPHEAMYMLSSSQESAEDATCSSFSVNGSNNSQSRSSQSSFRSSQALPADIHPTAVSGPLESADKPSNHPDPQPKNVSFPTSSFKIMSNGNLGQAFERSYTTAAAVNTSSQPNHSAGITGSTIAPDVGDSLLQKAPVNRRTGNMVKRRNASFAIFTEGHGDALSLATSSIKQDTAPGKLPNPSSVLPKPLQRTSSMIRLSMSLDGKAKVITGEDSSPSPPRSQPLPFAKATSRPGIGLQRSQSAIEPNSSLPIESILSSVASRRPMTGRSRDARTWEFYCDSDARNALTIQAEREQSGSAVGAIGLIRSRSSKAMAANPNKRNAHQAKQQSMKRIKPDSQRTQKPKLARAISSVARLQSVTGNAQKQDAMCEDMDLKPKSQPAPYQDASGDSDKENWEPGTQTSSNRRRRVVNPQQFSRMRRPVLEENAHVPSHSSSLDILLNRGKSSPQGKLTRASSGAEIVDLEEDEEVTAFMGGSSIPREVEDLDCVQNLLSLSQAAWQ